MHKGSHLTPHNADYEYALDRWAVSAMRWPLFAPRRLRLVPPTPADPAPWTPVNVLPVLSSEGVVSPDRESIHYAWQATVLNLQYDLTVALLTGVDGSGHKFYQVVSDIYWTNTTLGTIVQHALAGELFLGYPRPIFALPWQTVHDFVNLPPWPLPTFAVRPNRWTD